MIFGQLGFSYERQPGRTARVCAPFYEGKSCVLVVTFGVGTYRRQQKFRSLWMHDDFLLLFPKMPQVKAVHAWLCSNLACVYTTARVAV